MRGRTLTLGEFREITQREPDEREMFATVVDGEEIQYENVTAAYVNPEGPEGPTLHLEVNLGPDTRNAIAEQAWNGKDWLPREQAPPTEAAAEPDQDPIAKAKRKQFEADNKRPLEGDVAIAVVTMSDVVLVFTIGRLVGQMMREPSLAQVTAMNKLVDEALRRGLNRAEGK